MKYLAEYFVGYHFRDTVEYLCEFEADSLIAAQKKAQEVSIDIKLNDEVAMARLNRLTVAGRPEEWQGVKKQNLRDFEWIDSNWDGTEVNTGVFKSDLTIKAARFFARKEFDGSFYDASFAKYIPASVPSTGMCETECVAAVLLKAAQEYNGIVGLSLRALLERNVGWSPATVVQECVQQPHFCVSSYVPLSCKFIDAGLQSLLPTGIKRSPDHYSTFSDQLVAVCDVVLVQLSLDYVQRLPEHVENMKKKIAGKS